MKKILICMFTAGFIAGLVAAYATHDSDAKPVMIVDFGTQQCLSVDGDPNKCGLYSKHDVIVKNNAFQNLGSCITGATYKGANKYPYKYLLDTVSNNLMRTNNMTTKTAAKIREAVAKQYADFYDHKIDLENALDGIEYAANLYASLNNHGMLPAAEFILGLDKLPNLVKTCARAWKYRLEPKSLILDLMIELALQNEWNFDDFRILGCYHRDYGPADVLCSKIALLDEDPYCHKRYLLEKLEVISGIINNIMAR